MVRYVNLEKSLLDPESSKEFIGYIVDTDRVDYPGKPCVWIEIPRPRINRVRRDIRKSLNKGKLSAMALARIAGQCISMAKAVIPAKLLLRNIYRLLAARASWQDILYLGLT
jgi:hypothetical protein